MFSTLTPQLLFIIHQAYIYYKEGSQKTDIDRSLSSEREGLHLINSTFHLDLSSNDP